MSLPLLTGRVRRMMDTYGFITGEDGGDYFFVPSGVLKSPDVQFESLQPEDPVMFRVVPHRRGPRAVDIRRHSVN